MADDTKVPMGGPTSLEAVSVEQISKMNSEDAKVYYTWANLFSAWMAPHSSVKRTKYLGIRDIVREEQICDRCEQWKEKLFQTSEPSSPAHSHGSISLTGMRTGPIIRFLRSEINKLGPDLRPEHVRCRRCGPSPRGEVAGGYSLDYGIQICANNLRNRGHLEDVIAHEMIHGWDDLRFHIDNNNLRHQACTEIRASMLSGECRFTREFFLKSQWKVTQQLQECVRRRAVLSLMRRPGYENDVQAAKVVNEVWDSCFNDTRPFDEIFR